MARDLPLVVPRGSSSGTDGRDKTDQRFRGVGSDLSSSVSERNIALMPLDTFIEGVGWRMGWIFN